MPEVRATPAAVTTLERLRERHGDLVLHQSGGCCAGSTAMCLGVDELPPGPHDISLGEVGGVPFLIDADLHRRLGSPDFLLDVAPGREDTFSLEGADDVHFTTRVRPAPSKVPGAPRPGESP
jgi:uncharacterized protein (DUF779 family)